MKSFEKDYLGNLIKEEKLSGYLFAGDWEDTDVN